MKERGEIKNQKQVLVGKIWYRMKLEECSLDNWETEAGQVEMEETVSLSKMLGAGRELQGRDRAAQEKAGKGRSEP